MRHAGITAMQLQRWSRRASRAYAQLSGDETRSLLVLRAGFGPPGRGGRVSRDVCSESGASTFIHDQGQLFRCWAPGSGCLGSLPPAQCGFEPRLDVHPRPYVRRCRRRRPGTASLDRDTKVASQQDSPAGPIQGEPQTHSIFPIAQPDLPKVQRNWAVSFRMQRL